MSAEGCRVGALIRRLLVETATPPPADTAVEVVLESARRSMMARQAVFAEAGEVPPHVSETHAECEALARRLSDLEEEWRRALVAARRQVSTQLRSSRQLRRFATGG